MKPKLLLCLALVLSGGLFGCSTIKSNHAAALPIKNTTNGLVPIFDMAMPVPDWKDYEFLTNAIIDDDPPASPGLRFTGAFQLDLELREGPVLMIEYNSDNTEPASKWLAFFVGNTNQGYRLILPTLNLFFGKDQQYPQPPSTNTVYINDADGDGQQELLSFGMNKTGEQLNACYKYERSLGIFEDYYVPDKSGPVMEGWGQAVMKPSPEAYRKLRKQGPIHLISVGHHDDYSDVSQAQKHFYKPNGKSLLQMAADIQAAKDDPFIPPSAYGTTFLNYSNRESPEADGIVVTDLGGATFIHAAAASWPALVAKVKPTFAWNGGDLMWIEQDTNGRPQFVLDEAYLYQPTNQPRQWVLLRTSTPKMSRPDVRHEEPRFFYSDFNWFTVATLQKTVPHSDHGENYAVAIATHRQQGTVYEIGWQREMSVGSGHAEYGRRIYIFRDRANHWHFLGEGPEEGWERGGGNTVESKVVWENSLTNDLPFQIRFHCEETTSPYNNSTDDTYTNTPPSVTICYDSALVSELPVQCQFIGHNPYLLAEKNDTLEKITLRLGFFMPGWDAWPDEAKQQAERKRILGLWRAAIVRLNPKLPQHGTIDEGKRVDLVEPGELENHLIEMERQTDTSKS